MKISASLALTILCVAISVTGMAQQTVTTKDGRRVVLEPDGTWFYATNGLPNITGSALETVRAYRSAPSWHDRVSFVLDPERVKPLMEARYAIKKWEVPDFHLLTQDEPTPSQTGWVKVDVSVSGEPYMYYLKKTKDGYRIDWEASEGFSSMSAAEFNATCPTTPVRFRALVKLDNYYNYEFIGARNTAYSIKVRDGLGKHLGNGYIDRNGSMGRSLFEKLKDGKEHLVIVDLQYLPNAQSSRSFLISKVVSLDGWMLE